ncbi:YggT family protein [Thermotalea metallivorans]|uniref:YggT family protein n=1 Tax=Thermotalea metallivorans TaxID=520762 RepID=UPI0008392737|nr:YggT family protein [Thermotalea metallivorans]
MWTMKASINYFFNLLNYLIIARIVLSWIFPNPYGSISRILYQLTEPILAPFRNLLSRFGLGGGYVDFSPILAVWALMLLKIFILSLL